MIKSILSRLNRTGGGFIRDRVKSGKSFVAAPGRKLDLRRLKPNQGDETFFIDYLKVDNFNVLTRLIDFCSNSGKTTLIVQKLEFYHAFYGQY